MYQFIMIMLHVLVGAMAFVLGLAAVADFFGNPADVAISAYNTVGVIGAFLGYMVSQRYCRVCMM